MEKITPELMNQLILDAAKIELPEFAITSTGVAAFIALEKAVNELAGSAPKDHDIIIQAFNIFITEARYIEPNIFLFSCFNNEWNNTFVVAHCSQLIAHVVCLPKHNKERVITGFARIKENK